MQNIRESFEKISPYYDRIMRTVDYVRWIKYIETLFFIKGRKPKKILDIACGTGSPTLLLRQRGYDIVGFDIARGMIIEFRKKQQESGTLIPSFVGDVRDIPLQSESFDAVISIFDSLNNLHSRKELLKAFYEVRRVLRKPGAFVFDLNTKYVLEKQWDNKIRVEKNDDSVSIWESSFKNNISTLKLTIFIKDKNGQYTRLDNTFKERGYNRKEVETALKTAGFSRVESFEHLTFNAPQKDAWRITYLAQT